MVCPPATALQFAGVDLDPKRRLEMRDRDLECTQEALGEPETGRPILAARQKIAAGDELAAAKVPLIHGVV